MAEAQTPTVPSLPRAIVESYPEPTVMRIGTVTRFDSAKVSVNIGGASLIDAAYLLRQYEPSLGDYVVVLKQQASWVCLGALGGIPDNNLLTNPSFEYDNAPNVFPSFWATSHSGPYPSTVETALLNTGGAVEGIYGLRIQTTWNAASGAQTVTDHVYSEPIPVNPGERYAVSGWVRHSIATSTNYRHPIVQLSIDFYDSPATAYPGYVSTEQVDSATIDFNGDWQLLTSGGTSLNVNGHVVPDGAGWVRVRIINIVQTHANPVSLGMSTYYDRILLRKVI